MPALGTKTFTNPALDHRFIQVLFYSVMLFNVTIQFEFMFLLPHFLKLYNKFVAYKDKYGVSGDFSLFHIIASSSSLTLFLMEGIADLYYLRRRMNNLENEEGLSPCTFEIYGFSIFCRNLNLLTTATFILFHVSMVYALAFFYIFTFMIEQRLLRIQQLLSLDVFQDQICTIQSRNPYLLKLGQNIKSEKLALATDQLIDIKEIFNLFNNSAQLLILTFVTFGTVELTVIVYSFLSTFSRIIIGHNPSLYLSSSLVLVLSFKLFWLTNCGERIANRVSCYACFHL